MSRTKGSFSLAGAIEPLISAPLDARDKVATKAELTISGNFPYPYVGMETYVVAEDKKYRLIGEDPTDIENWKEVTEGGGTVDYSDVDNKPSIENVTLNGNKSASDLGLAKSSDLPTKTSDLTNDSGFITKAVDDLVNYYLSSQLYTKTEVDAIVAAIKNSRFEAVSTLPTENIKTNIIYLVPKSDSDAGDIKDEYINLDGTTSGWEKIGSTDVDLSGYVTTQALNTALADYTTTADLNTTLANYITTTALNTALADYTNTTDLTALLAAKQNKMQVSLMPTADDTYEGKILQYMGATTSAYTHGYFYECVSDGESSPTYSWEQTDVQPSSGGGGAELEAAVTSNLAVGAIASGTTLEQGTTFTEFVQKLLITEIAPTTTFTASGSGIKEVGTSVTPTLTLVINTKGTGTPTAIKFYDGSTLLDTKTYVDGTNTYTFTMDAVTTTRTVKGVLEYKKSNDVAASVEKSATYTFVMASYYGAVTTAPTDKAGIVALTKNVKNSKAQTATFTLSNQRSCYCYPASFGNLTSIKDANNFEYLSSYTKTNVTVDEVSYNVYTLTDPVTATGFKQVYA